MGDRSTVSTELPTATGPDLEEGSTMFVQAMHSWIPSSVANSGFGGPTYRQTMSKLSGCSKQALQMWVQVGVVVGL